jgi:hypothetical protein
VQSHIAISLDYARQTLHLELLAADGAALTSVVYIRIVDC